MAISASEAADARFVEHRDGYDAVQVDAFVARVAATLDRHERELAAMRAEVGRLEHALDLAHAVQETMQPADTAIKGGALGSALAAAGAEVAVADGVVPESDVDLTKPWDEIVLWAESEVDQRRHFGALDAATEETRRLRGVADALAIEAAIAKHARAESALQPSPAAVPAGGSADESAQVDGSEPALASAQDEAEQLIAGANAEARQILSAAHESAYRVNSEAEEQSISTVRSAEEDAARLVAEAEEESARLVADAEEEATRRIATAEEMAARSIATADEEADRTIGAARREGSEVLVASLEEAQRMASAADAAADVATEAARAELRDLNQRMSQLRTALRDAGSRFDTLVGDARTEISLLEDFIDLEMRSVDEVDDGTAGPAEVLSTEPDPEPGALGAVARKRADGDIEVAEERGFYERRLAGLRERLENT